MQRFILFFLRMLLALRYRVKVKGLKGIKADQGILFLANHPAEVDPLFLMTRLWNRFRVRPVAGDFLFHLPFVSWCVRQVDAIPVPAFDQSSNSFKQRRIEKVYEEAADHLKNKKNILIYPAGMLAITDHEVVGAASGVYELLQRVPDAKVVLVNTRGLWGSSFSKALTGKRPDIMPTFARGIKAVLKNLLFFTPRRHVTMEFKEDMNFPRKAEKLEMNRYLEKWFNRDGPEKLSLVSFSMWKEVLPTVEEKKSARKFSIDAIPQEVQERVLREIAELTNKREEDLLPEHDLSLDLGMDSLDKSQVSVMLREQFGVNQVNSSELTNILSVMSFAAHIEKSAVEEERAESKASLWGKEKGRPDPVYPEADTLIEGFLRTATKMDRYFAAADLMSGEVNYRRLKLGVVLFALYLKDLPGDKIGIMLPASIAVDISMLACQLVGKTPVMINWTLGPRNLQSVVEQTGIKHTLSSWKFLDRLNNVELGPLDDQLVLLEEVRGGL
ncbi:MAG: 1-acyl-sn-glycerol-3-phosphate acyltransferase, partial [Chlamydiae bacterium]|nr:1-acyl-sn-glycerol-3-phosphate acyltransferase [Chlamydiota bacterium]